MVRIKSFVVVLIVLFSALTFTAADGSAELIPEVEMLEALGILDGGDGGITTQYAQREVDRITVAATILKLKGRYHIARDYHSDYTFLDAYTVPWAEGKNVLAYIKATGMLSGNSKGEFMPFDKISEKEYYKLLLEILGYKQTTSKTKGDFRWDDTLDFAKKVGFKPEGTDKFTVEDMAQAAVAALKMKRKDGKVYSYYLVDKGRLDKAKAVSLGLYVDTISKVMSAKAIGNKVVEVVFQSGNSLEMATDKSNYSIDGLEINGVAFINEKTVHLKTSAQQKYKAYNLKVSGSSVRFTGIAKASGAPYITSLKAENQNTVVLNFSRVLDYTSASNINNYKISGIDVKRVDAAGKKVTLTTSELAINRNYNIRMTRIKSIDNVSMESEVKRFSYYVDLTPPEVTEVKTETNERVAVYFSEAVDKASAENLNNYVINNANGELKILKAEIFGTKKDGVRLTTEPQRANSRYRLNIQDVCDTSKAANKMKKPVTKTFFGMKPDTAAPVFVRNEAEIISKNQIRLVFTDDSNIDEKSVLDIKNYSMNQKGEDGETIIVTKTKKESYSGGKYKVLLTVDDLEPKGSYTVIISGIKDEFQNEFAEDNVITLRMSSKLAAPAAIKGYNVVNNSKVEFTFTKALDKTSAEDIHNYIISDDIGTPYNATYRYNKLTLETETMEEVKQYKLSVDGLEDIVGNVLKFSYNFMSKEEPPIVESISQTDERSFEITMSEDVVDITPDKKVYAGGNTFYIKIDKNDKNIVTLTADSDIMYDKEYSFDISKVLADKNGIKAKNDNGSKTILIYSEDSSYQDFEKPYIVNVLAIDESIIEVEYNEDIGYQGAYSIEYYDDEEVLKSLTIESCDIRGALVVIRLDEDTTLEDEYNYDLIIKTPAKDLSGNISSNRIGEDFSINRQ